MTSVYVFTFFGDQIRTLISRIFKKKKKNIFSKNNRRFVVIWKKYGIMGIAFLTPIFLTPIGGTITANALGCKKEDIFKYMWISSLFWSYTITWLVKFAKDYLFFSNNSSSEIVQANQKLTTISFLPLSHHGH